MIRSTLLVLVGVACLAHGETDDIPSPVVTCATLKCEAGYGCEDTPTGAECHQLTLLCGGPTNRPCPDGQRCHLSADCKQSADCSGVCKDDFDSNQPAECSELETYSEGCNTCTCINGKFECTDFDCKCKDGETYEEGCNICTCVNEKFECTNFDCKCQEGETYEEGCNICTCTNGKFECTDFDCKCKDGETYDDGCNYCTCINEKFECTDFDCKCQEGETYEEGCNTCTCANGKFECTDFDCKCKDGETYDDGCNICTCVNEKFECTDFDCKCQEGETYEEGCNTCTCVNGKFECTDIECQPSKGCKSNADCSDDEFCRLSISEESFDCGVEMVCVPRAQEGEPCGGFTTPCSYNICHQSLKCITSQLLPDIPGVCMQPTLIVGDVCRTEDPVTWLVVDRSDDCPEGTKCTPNEDFAMWTCETSTVPRCTPSSCGGDKCFISDGMVQCASVASTPDTDCDLRADDVVFCAAGGVCKEGFACTGCRQTCHCDDSGAKVCSKECRPTCEKVGGSIDCMSEPVSEWKALGCRTYSCFGHSKSPSMEEMRYCCEKTGRYCREGKEDKFSCRSDPDGWHFAQRKWCCEQKQVGCPVALFDCSIPDDSVQITKSADGLLQTSVDVSMWGEEKAAYCCDEFQVGCPTDKDLFNCDWSYQTFAPWSDEQMEWCCSVKGERCPEIFDLDEDEDEYKGEMCQVKKAARAAWDEETRAHCCLNEGCGCGTEKYDCYGDDKMISEWDNDQRKWCCEEEDIACRVNCRVGSHLLSYEEKEDCCYTKGLHCEGVEQLDQQPTEEYTKEYKKSIRLLFKGSISKIMENPKRFLKKFRNTILRVSKGLKSSGLMVQYVGGLMKDNKIPPQDALERWGTSIPASWNSQLFAEEEAAVDQRGVATLGHGVSSKRGQQAVGDQGAFIDLDIQDDDATVVEMVSTLLATAIDESRVGGGQLRDNGDGSTVILEPVGRGMEELPSPSNDNTTDTDEDTTVLLVVIGAIASLCLGGVLVALAIYKRNQSKPSDDSEFLSTMVATEEKGDQITRI